MPPDLASLRRYDLHGDPHFAALANARLGPTAPPLSDAALAYLASMPDLLDLWKDIVDSFVRNQNEDKLPPYAVARCVESMSQDVRFDLCVKKALEAVADGEVSGTGGGGGQLGAHRVAFSRTGPPTP